jgi:hypothetical protein
LKRIKKKIFNIEKNWQVAEKKEIRAIFTWEPRKFRVEQRLVAV